MLLLVVIFAFGYYAIAAEHKLKIDKAIPALLTGAILWAIVAIFHMPLVGSKTAEQAVEHHTGGIGSILFFVIGAMAIVNAMLERGSFDLFKDWIRTNNQIHLMWITTAIAFLLSAVLDNMTTTIVMIAILSKILSKRGDKMVFAVIVVIAANAGGAWSPIGDITTTMLWIAGKVSTSKLIFHVLLPSITQAVFVPAVFSIFPNQLSRLTEGVVEMENENTSDRAKDHDGKKVMLFLGIAALIFVPVFKVATHLPPYIGMLFSAGIVMLVNEYYNMKAYKKNKESISFHHLLANVEWNAVLFFLGILMSVAVFESVAINGHGALESAAGFMSEKMPLPVFGTLLGLVSAVIDNIPLVFASISMFKDIPADNWFWHFIAYTAGTGGSILIIGSASGVIAMSMLKIDFLWHMKRFTPLILLSYLAGVAVFLLQLKAFS